MDTNYNGFGGMGGDGLWIFALIVLLGIFGGGGGLFGGNGLTNQDLQRAVDLNSIQEGQASIRADVQRTAYENMATVKDAAYNNLSEIRDLQMGVNTGFANMQNCCCETNRNIDGVRFDMANYAASINATSTANTQKVLDAISTNRIADMQNRINQLELQSALCGIPRANMSAYNLVPAFGTGCGCGGTTLY